MSQVAAPRVLDLAGRIRTSAVQVASSPVTELCVGLSTFQFEEGAETFDVGREWFDQVRTALAPDVLAALERVGHVAWGNLLAMALADGWPPDAGEFVERVSGMDPLDHWLTLAGVHLRPFADRFDAEIFRRAAGGDQDARGRLAAIAREAYGDEEEDVRLLRMDVGEVHALVVTALRGWHRDVLAADEARTIEILDRDADAKRREQRTVSDEKLIELATHGVVWVPEPWVRRIILTPHLAMRPWNVMCAHEDAYVLCYPAADESLGIDRTAPPAHLLRLHKALADERRLRILKLLADGDRNLQELSETLGMAKSTAHHHTVILRAAGLIRTSTAMENRYSLRRDALGDAGAALARFLEGGSP